MDKGRFITFEGGEGTGKSTHAHLLQEKFESHGISAVLTREPGGSPGAEEIRHMLLKGDAERWSPLSEALLFYAARDDHLRRTIRPSLRRGYWVICDRFADSSHAYQGAASGVGEDVLNMLDEVVVNSTMPDLTIILDLPAETGLQRTLERDGDDPRTDRFERKKLQFHENLREGFLNRARKHPGRCYVVDSSRPKEAVAARIWDIVKAQFAAKLAASGV